MSSSPVENKIAFSQNYLDINGVDLVFLDLSSGEIQRLENKFDDFHPVWSPTGDELLYVGGPEFSFELYKLNITQMKSSPLSFPFSDNYKHLIPMDWNQEFILLRGQLASESNLSGDKLIIFHSDTNKWFTVYESKKDISVALFSPNRCNITY